MNETRAATIDAELMGEDGPGGMLTRLARVGLLLDDFQHRCFDPFGLRFVDYSVLKVLYLTGPPHEMTPTRLSELVVRSTGGMTQILDRLERHGLVERAAHPGDRRRVVVSLTSAGSDLIDRANDAYAAHKSELLDGLDEAELARIDRAVASLLGILTADREHFLAAPRGSGGGADRR